MLRRAVRRRLSFGRRRRTNIAQLKIYFRRLKTKLYLRRFAVDLSYNTLYNKPYDWSITDGKKVCSKSTRQVVRCKSVMSNRKFMLTQQIYSFLYDLLYDQSTTKDGVLASLQTLIPVSPRLIFAAPLRHFARKR